MKKKVLILGVTGMLGNTVFKEFFKNSHYETWGTLRARENLKFFTRQMQTCLVTGIDVLEYDSLVVLFDRIRPDIVINCIGIIKQHSISKDPLLVLPINSMFPHRVAKLCSLIKARLIHISTDCVFSGKKGLYIEDDISDAEDLYGKSKYIGEIYDLPNVVTLRTSIIGHELNGNTALVDWFLAQTGSVRGYKNAIFSGLPTIELAHVIMNYVAENRQLCGLYHVSAEPIAKYNLLKLIAEVYERKIKIIADVSMCIDRSLDSRRFQKETGYMTPPWKELIEKMAVTWPPNNRKFL